MYDELIKRLRASCESCKLWDGYKCCLKGECSAQTRLQAADAIEDLSAAVEGYESSTNMVLVEKDGETVIEFQPKWIPVTERLPNSGVCVLVTDGLEVGEGWLTEITNTRGYFMRWCAPTADIDVDRRPIAYWMPLPSTEGLNET